MVWVARGEDGEGGCCWGEGGGAAVLGEVAVVEGEDLAAHVVVEGEGRVGVDAVALLLGDLLWLMSVLVGFFVGRENHRKIDMYRTYIGPLLGVGDVSDHVTLLVLGTYLHG